MIPVSRYIRYMWIFAGVPPRGASVVKSVMVVACVHQIVTFTLLYKANICDLSLGHAHSRLLASFRRISVIIINTLECTLLGEFE